jgi:hypothetical protein
MTAKNESFAPDANAPDELIPDPPGRQGFGISAMGIWMEAVIVADRLRAYILRAVGAFA